MTTETMIVYHTTDASTAIRAEGFKDGEKNYMTTETWRGVWVANTPVDINEGAKGDVVLALEIPIEIFNQYEWVEDEKTYRESLIPAEILNKYGLPKICTMEELEILADKRWNTTDNVAP